MAHSPALRDLIALLRGISHSIPFLGWCWSQTVIDRAKYLLIFPLIVKLFEQYPVWKLHRLIISSLEAVQAWCRTFGRWNFVRLDTLATYVSIVTTWIQSKILHCSIYCHDFSSWSRFWFQLVGRQHSYGLETWVQFLGLQGLRTCWHSRRV